MKNTTFARIHVQPVHLRALHNACLARFRGLLKLGLLNPYGISLVLLLTANKVCGSPCVDPKRMVGGHAVDLRPLMDWWAEPKGLRPLSRWKHVRGTITEDTALGWIMAGKAEGEGHPSRFFVRNPPRERLARFQELKRQMPGLEQARVATQELLRRPVHSFWNWALLTQRHGQVLSLAEHREAAEHLKLLDREINSAREELAPMEDEDGKFRLDAFALRLNEKYQGVPVFDHGYPLRHLQTRSPGSSAEPGRRPLPKLTAQ